MRRWFLNQHCMLIKKEHLLNCRIWGNLSKKKLYVTYRLVFLASTKKLFDGHTGACEVLKRLFEHAERCSKHKVHLLSISKSHGKILHSQLDKTVFRILFRSTLMLNNITVAAPI